MAMDREMIIVGERSLPTDRLDGLVTMRVAATYPPEEAAETHRRMKAGGTRGRCVITF